MVTIGYLKTKETNMMLEENVTADITVIGGGLAGVCAAIAAARLNHKVTLVQNRGVLGGIQAAKFVYGWQAQLSMELIDMQERRELWGNYL